MLCLFIQYYLVWSFRLWFMLSPYRSILIRTYCFFLSNLRLIFCSLSWEDMFFWHFKDFYGFSFNFSALLYMKGTTFKSLQKLFLGSSYPFLWVVKRLQFLLEWQQLLQFWLLIQNSKTALGHITDKNNPNLT